MLALYLNLVKVKIRPIFWKSLGFVQILHFDNEFYFYLVYFHLVAI